ncbi:MAG: GAF domain-containing protein, partial [Candidatus Promineifilaceae bacterium]|nr:GAF domain-containing protein [Candidatus Promineifilaceae bacterium]
MASVSEYQDVQPEGADVGPGASIRSQLIGSNFILGVLLLAALALVFWQVARLFTAVNTLEAATEWVEVVSEARFETSELEAEVNSVVRSRSVTLFPLEVSQALDELEETQPRLRALAEDAADPAIANGLASVHQQVGAVMAIAEEMVVLARDEEWLSVIERLNELNRAQEQVSASVAQLLRQVEARERDALAEVVVARRNVLLYPTAIILLAGVLAGLLVWRTINSIAGPVEGLTAGALRFAAGRFEERVAVPPQQEMGVLARAFNQMAAQLEESYGALEQRVAERTRDLALASEVGQRLSELRDPEHLLQDAVERIRDRFDLYYTQIYLTDPSGRRLTLYAGTGDVGEELVQRGHHLAISRSSITGTAAVTKEPVIISGTQESEIFLPNPLLPETRSEMAVPLVRGDRVLGVLDLQSAQTNGLTEESLPAFAVVASQLAGALENARLFQEVHETQAEIAAQMERRLEVGWQAFLNAIERRERVGFAYEEGELEPLHEPLPPQTGKERRLQTGIKVGDVPIGAIQLEADEYTHWTANHLEVVNSVAEQVARQVENLRLLAEAERYRVEAEEALRRQLREGWEAYRSVRGNLAFAYAAGAIVPLREDRGEEDGPTPVDGAASRRPLVVQGEPVGELVVAKSGKRLSEEERQLVQSVAQSLSAHIENLRLAEQREIALGDVQRRSEELAVLNRVVTEVTATLDLQKSLEVVARGLVEATSADQARVALLNDERNMLTIVAEEHDPGRTPSAYGVSLPVAGNPLSELVLARRAPLVVHDPQHDPELEAVAELFAEQGIEAILVLPLLAGDEILGTVGMDILNPDRTFDDDEVRLAESIVGQASAAIQNANLFDQMQEALEETRILYRASAEMNQARNYEQVLDVIRQNTIAGRDVTNVALVFFDQPWTDEQTPEWLEVAAYWSPEPVEDEQERYPLAMFPSAREALKANEPTFVEDLGTDPHIDDNVRWLYGEILNAQSALFVPLWAAGQWIGYVTSAFRHRPTLEEAEMRRLTALVDQASVAVQSIRLLEETNELLAREQRQRRVADTMLRATGRMTGILEEEPEILRILAEEVTNLLNARATVTYEWAPSAERFEVVNTVGRSRISVSGGSAEKRPQLWNVFTEDELELHVTRAGAKEYVRLPWRVGNNATGVIEVIRNEDAPSIRDEDRASVIGVVQQAAIRLQGARLFAETETRAAELAVLHEMGQALTTLTDVESVAEIVLLHTSRLMNTDNFYIALYEPEQEMIRFPVIVENGERRTFRPLKLTQGLTGWVIRNREPLMLLDNVSERMDEMGIPLLGPPAESWLGTPMMFGDQVMGVITIQSPTTPHLFDEHDLELLNAIASSTAIAVQNARLFEETQERAAETRALYEAGRNINTARSYDHILDTLHRYTILGQKPQQVTLFYFDRPLDEGVLPDYVEVLSSRGRRGERPGRYRLNQLDTTPLLFSWERHWEPVIIEDAAEEEPWPNEEL